ncbi:MAG TPA: hypothetical protein VIY48_03825 [Candidatus Paceibacterota bacterium]
MASNWPTSPDNFNIPNSPGTTALSSSGTGSRNHVQHHRDLGDAIEAMQPEATLLVHSHDGSTARHGSKLAQANTHQSADTDVGPTSIHHTLGHGANQAAPGNHSSLPEFSDTHSGAVAWPVGSVFMTTVAGNPSGAPHNLGGTWVQITDAFLIGVGGTYTYTGSVVSNPTTHTHTVANTAAAGGHSHTNSISTDAQGFHDHGITDTGSTAPWHVHDYSGGPTGGHSATPFGADVSGMVGYHSHALTNYSAAYHTHAGGGVGSDGSHTHVATGNTSAQADHSHTVTASTVSHAPPWLAIYTWRRTA